MRITPEPATGLNISRARSWKHLAKIGSGSKTLFAWACAVCRADRRFTSSSPANAALVARRYSAKESARSSCSDLETLVPIGLGFGGRNAIPTHDENESHRQIAHRHVAFDFRCTFVGKKITHEASLVTDDKRRTKARERLRLPRSPNFGIVFVEVGCCFLRRGTANRRRRPACGIWSRRRLEAELHDQFVLCHLLSLIASLHRRDDLTPFVVGQEVIIDQWSA